MRWKCRTAQLLPRSLQGNTHQDDLFGEASIEAAAAIAPAEPAPEVVRVAQSRPKNVHYGTSSWSFPGWEGIVYAGKHTASALAHRGLAAYARHPLLNCVGIDRTFYAPVAHEELERYAAAVPEDFRFIVKAYSGITTDPESGRGARQTDAAEVFLDAAFATREVIAPLTRALRQRLGAVLFQFSPLSAHYLRAPETFAARLGEFLEALPQGVPYTVEMRDSEVLVPAYEQALRSGRASHCSSVHSRMPPVDTQPVGSEEAPQVIRWMLHSGYDYETAGAHYAPFDRLVEPDVPTRQRVVNLIAAGVRSGREVHVIAANNAEGSAPLTLLELAKAVAGSRQRPC
jgi:uncharacterized protein YecE (DUF72 family)